MSHLVPEPTYQLIASHGRLDIQLYYAALLDDVDRVVQFHMHRREYRTALEKLSEKKRSELFYKYSSTLIRHEPEATVDAWILNISLDPVKLIPALMAYNMRPRPRGARNQAIRYVEALIDDSYEPALHNYLVSLYAKPGDEEPARLRHYEQKLIAFLSREDKERLIDMQFALRVCREHQKWNACVHIYSQLALHEEAVDLALKIDDVEVLDLRSRCIAGDVAGGIAGDIAGV